MHIATVGDNCLSHSHNSLIMKKIFKKIPGIMWFYRSFINTPGSWIYIENNVKWLSNSENYSSLPNLYKFFYFYCRYAPKYRNKILGAETLHLLLSQINTFFGLNDQCSIKIGDYTVFLLLTDPRSLLIPGEISKSHEISLLFSYLGEGDTFVDIGANHGSFSIVASKIVGPSGLVIAIEPQPKLANLISLSLSKNNYSAFEVHQVACSDRNSEENFFIPLASSGSAGVFKNFSGISASDKITVKLIKFDDLIDIKKLRGKVFVKLDVEGSEISFIKGAFNAIKELSPYIMMEINPSSMKAANTTKDNLISLFHQLGYQEYIEIDSSIKMNLEQMNFSKQRNIIIVPTE